MVLDIWENVHLPLRPLFVFTFGRIPLTTISVSVGDSHKGSLNNQGKPA
jgi:hypothetical protein